MEYLNSRSVNFDSQMLYTAVNKKEPQKLLLNRDTHMKERENYKLVISPDNMKATVRFYPPSAGGELMTRNELVSDRHSRVSNTGYRMWKLTSFSGTGFIAKTS